MSEKIISRPDAVETSFLETKGVSRRKFFNYAGLSAAVLAVGTSCQKDYRGGIPAADFAKDDPKNMPPNVVQLGSGDIGILNYAYALEQLEAAFYIQVIKTPYSGISEKEMVYLTDIRDHEIAHREFFKNALGSAAIPSLLVNFSSINFSSRESVLGTARAFEDLGVSAYNGAGELLVSPDYLLLAGKIVSVEARHAATIRDLLVYGSFADPVDGMGLDLYRTPDEVVAIASQFLTTKLLTNKLPKS